MKASPEQIAKAEALRAAAEARRLGQFVTVTTEVTAPATDRDAEIESLHWQLHCERRRADAATLRASKLSRRGSEKPSWRPIAEAPRGQWLLVKLGKEVCPTVDVLMVLEQKWFHRRGMLTDWEVGKLKGWMPLPGDEKLRPAVDDKPQEKP